MDALPIRTDAELARLTMPVQLILGGKDTLLRSSETRDRMVRCVPNLRLTYLENEGHILPRQTGVIAGFLSDVLEVRIAV
jgi:pimeloyl-ACP methyl ester carboxylesterase